MTHRMNDGIVIGGRVYELAEHPGGAQRLCNDCALWRICVGNNTERGLCQDVHGKNDDGSEVWYNYKEVELKPIMA